MEIAIIALPLIASIISGFFGKFIGDRNSEIVTSFLVTISEFLSPINLPKKPDIIDAISGRNIIESSILILLTHQYAQLVLFLNFDSKLL